MVTQVCNPHETAAARVELPPTEVAFDLVA